MTSWHRRVLVWAAWGAAALGASHAAHAQSYISSSPSVVVDLGVLDSLGPARTTTLLRSTSPAAAPAAPVSTESLLEPPSSAPVSRLNVPVPTSPVRPPAAPVIAIAPAPTVEAPKPPTAAPRPAPAVQTAARPPVRTEPAPAIQPATALQATTSQAEAPARAGVRPATQVPPPPRPPEAPALTPRAPAPVASEIAPPAVAVPTVEAVRPPAAPQVAALPGTSEEYELRLEFESGSARLPDDGRQPLQELVRQLENSADTRLQLRAYAGGTAETSSLARRLSLSRALAVRSYLIEQGVRSTLMDVRALGNKSGDGPPDRVDIVLVDQ